MSLICLSSVDDDSGMLCAHSRAFAEKFASVLYYKLTAILRRQYLLLTNRARGPHWENIARGLSGQERMRAIFSQYGPELVRVNKKFIIWLYLTPNYLKSEP